MWTYLGSDSENLAPSSRTKHSATLLGGEVYLFGGRNGNLPLKDLWRYSLNEGKWNRLEPTGDCPPCLQEHSAVAYKDCIYIFGGEIGFSSGTETPLWIYNTKDNSWRKNRGGKGVLTPKGRRGHTALVFKSSMIIYGGYQDLRGSSNELWTYHFESESWRLISLKSTIDSLPKPSGRHKHSAVLHDGAMWIYGGMTDLQERGDLWRWDIASKMWCNIKTKSNPGPLHSHAVCKLPSSMLIFGGETNGLLLNDLWRFHFGTEVWEKLQFPGSKPHPRAESIALTVSEMLFKEDSTNHCENSSFSSTSQKSKNHIQPSENLSNRNRSNKIGPAEKKFFLPESGNNHATTGNLVTSAIQSNNLNFLKEISKLSSLNLSRLNRKCSYTVLNSSHDSTESLLKAKENSDSEQTPTRMMKSQSANFVSNNGKKKLFSSLTPGVEKFPNLKIAESGEFSTTDSDKSTKPLLIPRDPISVPNLNEFLVDPESSAQLPPTGNAEPVVNDSNKPIKNSMISVREKKNNGINLPCTPFIDDYQKADDYEFGKRCQSDSYSSHLANFGGEERIEPWVGIPKSASAVRFKKQPEIVDESTSDYCSIETVNKVSFSSNYSQSSGETRREPPPIDDYPDLVKFGKTAGNSSARKSVAKTTSGYGFSNPHYMGPDIQTMLKSKEVQKCAKVLNSPPDSVLEDPSKGRNENVEMKNLAPAAKSKCSSNQARSPPRYLPLRGNPYNSTTVPIATEKRKRFRGNSAGRGEKQEIFDRCLQQRQQQSLSEEFSRINMEPVVPLSVFLIGGKEHGQITVFKRPISLWKLRLSSNVY